MSTSAPSVIERSESQASAAGAHSLHPVVVPPRAYYKDDYATIYHADSEIVLAQMPVCDLLLTDPPYGIGENAKRQATRQGHGMANQRDYGSYDWDKEPPPAWMIGLARAKARWQIIWGGNYHALPPARGWLVWDKDNGETDFADCELAWTNLETAVRKKRYRWQGMLQEKMGREKETRVHPTQKPEELMGWCMGLVPEWKTVLDPWMGSGTTLVAAKARQRLAIGIERDEKQCENAAKRLSQEVLAL